MFLQDLVQANLTNLLVICTFSSRSALCRPLHRNAQIKEASCWVIGSVLYVHCPALLLFMWDTFQNLINLLLHLHFCWPIGLIPPLGAQPLSGSKYFLHYIDKSTRALRHREMSKRPEHFQMENVERLSLSAHAPLVSLSHSRQSIGRYLLVADHAFKNTCGARMLT
jgi:hypothetical protein